MRLIQINRIFTRLKNLICRRHSHSVALQQNEYNETPVYPPILDMSIDARKHREREILHKKIQEINTVEEKQIALNMPRYYGWKCVMLKEDKIPYNAMPLVQCYTRSKFIPIEKLPDIYYDSEQVAATVVQDIKSQIEDAIVIETEIIERNILLKTDQSEQQQIEDTQAKYIVRQINRIIMNSLTDKVPHILSAQVDYDPRHEAFWFVGGVDVPSKVIKWRKQYSWLKDRLYENVDRPVQYIGSPFIAVRSHLPLKPILPYEEAENPSYKVAKFTHIPASLGYIENFRHGTNIPGYWPGESDEFGLLSIHGRGHMLNRRESYGPDDNIEALHCQALKASFGWLSAQSNYQGFTTYNDLTYPLVTQTIITNGQLWSFYAYQLNTMIMHNENIDQNPKHNICFGTKPLKLYECIDNGKVQGLNEDVLKMLVQFYMNTPEERNYEMKPYLGKDEKVIADIEDDNKRCWLESRYKHLVSNRPKHFLQPETYLWEQIYKIEYNTRFFEAKRRPFELGINPYKRRLDDHLPPYIPKVLRPYPKSKKKFETTYYPKV